ncbi:transcriptional regulator, partial [Achromobacter sp. GG226]|uniref:PhaM family polyhydroxyalkanoate granule multifunctional regulatory protein n=1 Tax=Verticiella alkaliphila TaxID=2779529 RepID=UPI001C0B7628
MTTTPGNPFAFPGMGLGTPDGSGGNPVLQSLEMMRQAWTQMGGTNPFASAIPTTPILNLEELDKRIQELQAVANWLRLNMTMLQGSIQALEVQRATIATLRSFAQTASGAAAGSTGGAGEPSPLEVALGIKPHTRTSQEPPAEPAAAPKASSPEAPAAAPSGQAEDTAQPQQAWWNLLQNQFNQIAQAAAATMPTATPRPAAPSAPTKK